MDEAQATSAGDHCVVIAHLLSRGEAAVVESVLLAHGIPAGIGAHGHLSLTPIAVALGGYRITVPIDAWADASDILRPMAGETPVAILLGFRRRVVRLLLAWSGASMAFVLPVALFAGSFAVMAWGVLASLAAMLSMTLPPPPWRGDYYLFERSTN